MNAALELIYPAPTLNAAKQTLLARLTADLQPADLYWIAAYSASLAAQRPAVAGLTPEPAALGGASGLLTILYGSQTGNSRRVAEQFAAQAEASGLSVRLQRTGAYATRELAKERHLVVVISSQGDGDPPDDAIGLTEFIHGKRAPKLPDLQFSVLGLGDSSYPKYCAVSRELHSRLLALGAKSFAPLGEADVDFEGAAADWSMVALKAATEALVTPSTPARAVSLHAVRAEALHGRDRPFAAAVLENQRITSRDSKHEVRHIELSLEGSGLHYQPGDALGIWPRNPVSLVNQWLDVLKLDGGADVTHDGRTLPLAQWLERERDITRLTRPLVLAQAATGGHAELERLLQPREQSGFATLLETHQPIDLLRRYPAPWQPESLVAALRPLSPRLYSIASSPALVGSEEVHLTLGVVDYQAHGYAHLGAASSFLAGLNDDGSVPVFVEQNERFHLPMDVSRDVIMIGPGTGIAPFRAFVQERQATGASGRNWLFFGNRHFRHDFLYQVEWQEALRNGGLDRLDLAFSRDQTQKIYVQQRLHEQGRELYAWLREGAHIYVCGDSRHMAKDVNDALVQIIATHGSLSAEDASAWLGELLQTGRYARDVY